MRNEFFKIVSNLCAELRLVHVFQTCNNSSHILYQNIISCDDNFRLISIISLRRLCLFSFNLSSVKLFCLWIWIWDNWISFRNNFIFKKKLINKFLNWGLVHVELFIIIATSSWENSNKISPSLIFKNSFK
jgi:hypothetical protein